LSAALSDQKAFGGKLGRTLVELGYVAEDDLMSALAEQLGLDIVDLDEVQIDDAAVSALDVNACERYGVYPIKLDLQQSLMWIATAEPDHATLQEVAQITQLTLEPVLAPMSQIERALRRAYYGDRPGDAVKQRKGEPLLSIPQDSGLPREKAVEKLPSSAGPLLRDPDAPISEPQNVPPRPQFALPSDTGEHEVVEIEATPIEQDEEKAPSEPDLHAIEPEAGEPDPIEELQLIVLRIEKLVSAQGRAFRALVEILQEKGVVRRGELGARTTKKQ
jgi:hypothetical protein